jgi:hypothetical protein
MEWTNRVARGIIYRLQIGNSHDAPLIHVYQKTREKYDRV